MLDKFSAKILLEKSPRYRLLILKNPELSMDEMNILSTHGNKEVILKLLDKKHLPSDIIVNIAAYADKKVFDKLIEKHKLSRHAKESIAYRGNERHIFKMMAKNEITEYMSNISTHKLTYRAIKKLLEIKCINLCLLKFAATRGNDEIRHLLLDKFDLDEYSLTIIYNYGNNEHRKKVRKIRNERKLRLQNQKKE